MKKLTTITVTAALGLITQGAVADLSPEEASRLGGDELTPTSKLRRKPIHEKYAAEIEQLYA